MNSIVIRIQFRRPEDTHNDDATISTFQHSKYNLFYSLVYTVVYTVVAAVQPTVYSTAVQLPA